MGKTTLIKKLAEKFPEAVGFYTEEIREHGIRKGFRLASLTGGLSQGAVALLSHVDIKSPQRVGKYRVDIKGFESFMDNIPFQKASLVVVDEIGKMECISGRFRDLIKELLSSDKTVMATIAKKGTPFIEGIKKMPGVRLFEMTDKNREALHEEILRLMH